MEVTSLTSDKSHSYTLIEVELAGCFVGIQKMLGINRPPEQ